MKQLVYAMYDSKAEVYSRPMYMVNDATAVRNFVNACLDERSQMYSDPADFTLFRLGEWDDVTGLFSEEEMSVNLGNGLSLMTQHFEQKEKVRILRQKIADLDNFKGELE